MKKFFSFLSLAIFASGFNTLYKYVTVKENLASYNNSMFDSFITTSSSDISYISIFFLSLLFSLSIFILYLKRFSFDYRYVFLFSVLLLIASGLLFINVTFSVVFLILGFLIILYFFKHVFNIKIMLALFIFIFISLFIISS